jgi:hypothetical protein
MVVVGLMSLIIHREVTFSVSKKNEKKYKKSAKYIDFWKKMEYNGI